MVIVLMILSGFTVGLYVGSFDTVGMYVGCFVCPLGVGGLLREGLELGGSLAVTVGRRLIEGILLGM